MLLIAIMVIGSFAAVIGNQGQLYILAVFLFIFTFVARAASLVFRPRVSVTRWLPPRCAAGADALAHARVVNRGRLPVFDLTVTEKLPPPEMTLEPRPCYLPTLSRGGSADLLYTVHPERRGVYELRGPVAFSAFPFGIYHAMQEGDQQARMLVYPRFERLSAVSLPVAPRHQPGGLRLVSRVGESEEFVGNREYRPGDRLRDIHHAGWARLGAPVVREFQQEYLCRIALVLDTYVPHDRAAPRRGFGGAISLAAGIADALSRQEYVIDLFAAGPDLYHFQAGRSLAYLDNILDVLACIDVCKRKPFRSLGPAIAEAITQISTAVFVLLDWDEDRERFVQSIRNLGVAAKVLVVRERPSTLDPHTFAGDAGPILTVTPQEVEQGLGHI